MAIAIRTSGQLATPEVAPLRMVLLDKTPGHRYRLESVLTGMRDIEVLCSTRDDVIAVAGAGRVNRSVVIVDPSGFGDRVDLLERLRAATPEGRIVLLSELPADLLAEHADLVLTKDMDGGHLVRSLRTLL